MKNSSKEIKWVLNKATPTITLSKDSIILNSSKLSDTFTVASSGSGEITITSSDNSVATVSMNENVVTVVGKVNGTVTITVNVAENNNYNATSAQISVSVQLVSSTLNDNSWEVISQVAKTGDSDLYWDIGDCKEITLNGKIGNYLTLSNTKLCVFILNFNYVINGTAENNIIFGGFKTALQNGTDVALVDDKYDANLADGTICFNMNHWGNYNYGGWKGADFRYDILGATSTPPSDYGKAHTTSCVGYDATTNAIFTNPKADTLLAALPTDLRSNMRRWTRMVDAVGNSSNVDANIKITIDAITLLAESEIFADGTQGTDRLANKYERAHNFTPMAYYKNGNGTIRRKHKDSSTAVNWLESSPNYSNSAYFCLVNSLGDANYSNAGDSYALAPAFKI